MPTPTMMPTQTRVRVITVSVEHDQTWHRYVAVAGEARVCLRAGTEGDAYDEAETLRQGLRRMYA